MLAVLCYVHGYGIVCPSISICGSIFIYYKRALLVYGCIVLYTYNLTIPPCPLGADPPGADTPGSKHPLGADTPWEQTLPEQPPPKQTPPSTDTSQSRHPPEADTPHCRRLPLHILLECILVYLFVFHDTLSPICFHSGKFCHVSKRFQFI